MKDVIDDSIEKISHDLENLKKSPLYAYRTENKYVPVVGEGSKEADIVFIGEAPGENEAKTGKPFCGASGRILDEMLASILLDRKKVYVTNIVKDRPPKNRDPLPAEIELYAPFLERQINLIQPKVIATLGRFSMDWLMRHVGLEEKITTISNMHGKKFAVKLSFGKVHIIPLYHPAVTLYKGSMKKELLEDFQILKNFIKE
jgi:uracil-DNA glycosylase